MVRTTMRLSGEASRIRGIAGRLDPSDMLTSSTNVGLVGTDEPHGVADGARLGDHLAVGLGLEQAAQASTHDGVVVGQHHVDLLVAHVATEVGVLVRWVRGVPLGRCGFARITVGCAGRMSARSR